MWRNVRNHKKRYICCFLNVFSVFSTKNAEIQLGLEMKILTPLKHPLWHFYWPIFPKFLINAQNFSCHLRSRKHGGMTKILNQNILSIQISLVKLGTWIRVKTIKIFVSYYLHRPIFTEKYGIMQFSAIFQSLPRNATSVRRLHRNSEVKMVQVSVLRKFGEPKKGRKGIQKTFPRSWLRLRTCPFILSDITALNFIVTKDCRIGNV